MHEKEAADLLSVQYAYLLRKTEVPKGHPHRISVPLSDSSGEWESLEDRYINFTLVVSSYVAVSGMPVALAAFRPPTSEAHVSLVRFIKRQLRDFIKGCGGFDPNEAFGRTGRLLADALERAGAAGSISGLHGSHRYG